MEKEKEERMQKQKEKEEKQQDTKPVTNEPTVTDEQYELEEGFLYFQQM